MNALRVVFLGLAAAAALAQAAAAADLSGPSRRNSIKDGPISYEAPPFSWTGLYVGAHAGYGWSDIDWQGTPGGSHDGDGWLAGGQVGYNWQAGRIVYGIEADASGSDIDGGNGCCSHSVNWLASVRGRAGLASSDHRWLFYATAGGAWADVDYSGAGFGSFSETHFGWVAGGGIERALTSSLTARVEYLYYGFDSASAPAGAVSPGAAELDPTLQTVRFGVNWKF